MWSLTKPIGTTTTAAAPALATLVRQSLMSGPSQGTDGGPLLLWYASCQVSLPTAAATRPATSVSCAWYAPPSGPLAAAIDSGMLWAVNTISASSLQSAGRVARAREVAPANAAANLSCP